jgi:sensor histidine kinase YesM
MSANVVLIAGQVNKPFRASAVMAVAVVAVMVVVVVVVVVAVVVAVQAVNNRIIFNVTSLLMSNLNPRISEKMTAKAFAPYLPV